MLSLAVIAALALVGQVGAQAGPLLAGRIDNPIGSGAAMSAYGYYLAGGGVAVVATGDLAADGSFTIQLPAVPETSLLGLVDVSGLCDSGAESVTMSGGDAGHVMVSMLAAQSGEAGVAAVLAGSAESVTRLIGERAAPQAGDHIFSYLYSAAPLNVSGNCFDRDGSELSFNVAAPAGWSLLITYYHSVDEVMTVALETRTALSAEAVWVGID